MVELYTHQKTALDLLRLNDGFALFMEQGTGKTFPVLFRLAELAADGRIRSALVVAPKAVCPSWEDRAGMLSEEQRRALEGIRLEIASYDLVWRREKYTGKFWDALVLDESHYIKSPSAKRTKACLRLARDARYRYVLTGTPTSNGQLCNLWSQLAAVDPVKPDKGGYPAYPACLGGDSYYRWIERVAYLNKWRKPYRYRDVAALQEVMGEHSYRITKEECLDLPEKLPDDVLKVRLSKEAARVYKQMMRDSAVLELDTLAPNPLTRALRLRQLASGFLDTEGGERHEFPCAKLAALEEFLTDFERKFVVFCEFRHSIDAVAALLDKMGVTFTTLDGRQEDKGVWRDFQAEDGPRAIICQYQSGSAGIDLYAADTCIFFEPTLSSNLNEQAKDRIHRVGQARACSYIYLLTAGTVETAVYAALRGYEDFGEALFTRYIGEYTKGARL